MDRGEVTLRFSHPDRDLQFLSHSLDLAPSHVWAAGDPKRDFKGDVIEGRFGGIHKHSYWAGGLEFDPAAKGLVAEFKRTIRLLERAESDIRELVASGGTAEIYFFLPGQVTHGITIDQPTVAYMAGLGLMLSFEVVAPSKYVSEPGDTRP